MGWQIYLVISIILISLNGLFHRSILKDSNSDSRVHTIVFLGVGGIIAIVLSLIQGKLQFSFPSSLLQNFILLILLSTPAFVFSYRAYQLIGASEVLIFLTTGRLWNVVGAYFFLHEPLTAQKILGALIIFTGIAIVLFEKKKFKLNIGAVFALTAAFLFGMNDINGYYILRSVNATNFLIFGNLLPVFALVLIQPQLIKKISFYFKKQIAIKILLLCTIDTLGTIALYLAYQMGRNASVIGPLSATRVLLSVILATVILKERNNITNKIIGAIITVIGVIFLL
jgi:drug/metabolite transporter (DMT)-like permease